MYGASPVRFHWNLSLANGGVLNDEGYATLAERQALLASQVGCRFVLLRGSLEFAHWDGVRNFQARNFMRDEMKKGDLAFFYHSGGSDPGIVGIVEIAREGYPDH